MMPSKLSRHLRSFLFVGEGDFSFVNAFTRELQASGRAVGGGAVLATSYDGHAEVVKRYGAQATLEALSSRGVHVAHGVDATRLSPPIAAAATLAQPPSPPPQLHRKHTQQAVAAVSVVGAAHTACTCGGAVNGGAERGGRHGSAAGGEQGDGGGDGGGGTSTMAAGMAGASSRPCACAARGIRDGDSGGGPAAAAEPPRGGAAEEVYERIRSTPYDALVFQFPHTHGSKMKISHQRALLEAFLISAAQLLRHYARLDGTAPAADGGGSGAASTGREATGTAAAAAQGTGAPAEAAGSADGDDDGGGVCAHRGQRQVIVTLARGQGGTSADGVHRRKWGNSWQAVELAARAGLVLAETRPFEDGEWADKGYNSRGYRVAGAMPFHVDDSVTHVFVLEGQGVPAAEAHEHEHEISFFCGRVEEVRALLLARRAAITVGATTATLDDDAAAGDADLVERALSHLEAGGSSADEQVARLCTPAFDEAQFHAIVLETAEGCVRRDAIAFRELYVEPHEPHKSHAHTAAVAAAATTPTATIASSASDDAAVDATAAAVGEASVAEVALPRVSLCAWRRPAGLPPGTVTTGDGSGDGGGGGGGVSDGVHSSGGDGAQQAQQPRVWERRVKVGYRMVYSGAGLDAALTRDRSCALMMRARAQLQALMGVTYM